jgi:putative ABC transport system ATP-binding protein
MEPPIVLADEPTGNLDSANGQHVLELLGERQRESATTLVLVTHDPQIAERANRRIVLKDGMVVADVMQGRAVQADAGLAPSASSGQAVQADAPSAQIR